MGWGMKRLFAFAVLLSVAALLVAGCSSKNVKHLKRRAWAVESNQNINMKFWNFNYDIAPGQNSFIIKGTATPVASAIPPWANTINDIWFAAYLSDAHGRVIAQNLSVLPPGELPADGIPLTFTLTPDDLPTNSALYITFGYRMKLSGIPPGETEPTVFFASQGAMARF